jgi:hypothetical protein
MRTWKHAFAALGLTAGALAMHVPASSQTAPKLQQFVYVLKVSPAFHDPGSSSVTYTAVRELLQ